MRFRPILYLWISGLVFVGCSERQPPARGTLSSEDSLVQERRTKDAFFKSDKESPLLVQDRKNFQGLSYYPVDPAFRFQVALQRYVMPQQIRMATNTGEIRSGLLYGFFEITVNAQICKVQAYRLDDTAEPSLFIPFRDATSGTETYGAGRYIDLKENTSGVYDLDFNRAYNPYCAYNPTYSCPRPPAENILAVPIRAGEKKYPN